MEVAPPPYEKATSIDVWDIIARYIQSRDLCSAALVCRRWHATFLPHLWGNPASHFGLENDRVFVALTKFKRTLKTARLVVRSLTHTLHLPPAHAEIYNGPHSSWLRDVLTWLPNLQSLIVKGLPFFDHEALRALQFHKRTSSRAEQDDPLRHIVESSESVARPFQQTPGSLANFRLRLLDASRCPHVTSNSLAQALRRFESLIYLDLSYTAAARESGVIEALHGFSGLQVLRMRAISLRDREVELLATAIGRRIRSLDLRDNSVTDTGVRTLLDSSLAVDRNGSNGIPISARSPSSILSLGAEMLDIYQSEKFEAFLCQSFTARFVSRLTIEDVPEGGITHLYISNNALTVDGVSGLLRSRRLHVLDVGTIKVFLAKHPSVSGSEPSSEDWTRPGAEKLVPILHSHARAHLTFLRIDHTLMAEHAPNSSHSEVRPERVELSENTPSVILPEFPELDGSRRDPASVELPNIPVTPRNELPGDAIHMIISPPVKQSPYGANPPSYHLPRHGSACAPEVVDSDSTPNNTSIPHLTQGTNETFPEVSPSSPSSMASPLHASRPRTYSSLAADRQTRLKEHIQQHRTLHPAMLPRLRTLILTNVPAFSPTREVADRLITFVQNCAEESFKAKAQAKLDYALPPGRLGQASALRESADKLFALKRLVLEVAPQVSANSRLQSRSWQHSSSKSMTEDEDSEAMWSAAASDFSFFNDGDDDDESAFPDVETGNFAEAMGSSEKEVDIGGNGRRSSVRTTTDQTPRIDNIALLSAFRKDRNLAHQRHLAAGSVDAETAGYWDGLIQVVRCDPGLDADEQMDNYRNTYTNGHHYQ